MKRTEERLKDTMERQVPDSFDAILSRCNTERIGTTMEKKITKRNTSLLKKVTAIAAAVALVLTAGIIAYNANWFGGKDIKPANAVEAVIAFDVNPSLEIEIDKNENVIKVNCINDDAKKVVGDMKLENIQLNVAVNAIVGSMLKNGYLSVERNSILVSVKSDNAEKAEMLKKDISADIAKILADDDIEAAVLTQKFGDADEKAADNKISAAKASLIEKILAAGLKDASGNLYTYERLAAMSVNELKLVIDSKDVQIENVGSVGSASTGKYITEEEAISAALAHANITDDTYKVKVEMDYDDGMMLYEVDVLHGNYEYEYEINAETGAVVQFEKEVNEKADFDKPDNAPAGDSQAWNKYIAKEAAVDIAIAHAGVDKSTVAAIRTELDTDDGKAHYDIEFKLGTVEYEYEIDALTGQIIKSEKEIDDEDDKISTPADVIGEQAAVDKAMAHAGVDKATAIVVKCKLDREDGKYVYDIEFKVGSIEYDYEINAVTGEVVKAEKETGEGNQGNALPDDSTANPADVISKEAAIDKAMAHAGVDKASAKAVKCELDREDGSYVYEIEFRVDNVEYDYEIDAVSGKVIKSEKDIETDAPVNNGTGSEKISKEEALKIAYADAGVDAADVYIIKCELETDNGVTYYDAEFIVGKKEYDYDINAKTGAIIDKSVEVEDDKPSGNNGAGNDVSESAIGRDKAISIALGNANLKADEVTELECEYDVDNGVAKYEVSFKAKGIEYDYEIDANSGDFIKVEKEIDD